MLSEQQNKEAFQFSELMFLFRSRVCVRTRMATFDSLEGSIAGPGVVYTLWSPYTDKGVLQCPVRDRFSGLTFKYGSVSTPQPFVNNCSTARACPCV